MNKYWVPHLDIHKKVITQELQYYLGPEATVRPYTREVWCVRQEQLMVLLTRRLLRVKMVSL